VQGRDAPRSRDGAAGERDARPGAREGRAHCSCAGRVHGVLQGPPRAKAGDECSRGARDAQVPREMGREACFGGRRRVAPRPVRRRLRLRASVQAGLAVAQADRRDRYQGRGRDHGLRRRGVAAARGAWDRQRYRYGRAHQHVRHRPAVRLAEPHARGQDGRTRARPHRHDVQPAPPPRRTALHRHRPRGGLHRTVRLSDDRFWRHHRRRYFPVQGGRPPARGVPRRRAGIRNKEHAPGLRAGLPRTEGPGLHVRLRALGQRQEDEARLPGLWNRQGRRPRVRERPPARARGRAARHAPRAPRCREAPGGHPHHKPRLPHPGPPPEGPRRMAGLRPGGPRRQLPRAPRPQA